MIFVTVSTGHFDPLIEACDRLREKYEFFGQIGMGTYIPQFKHVKTVPPDELQKFMRDSELVISHAGTGMLSMLYKLRKKIIVIPKQTRYGESNDGQVELAQKWDELKMALLCMDVNALESALERAKHFTPSFASFPKIGDCLTKEFDFRVKSSENAA